MALSRKVEQVIERGGDVKDDAVPSKKFMILSQKVRMDALEKVDAAVAARPGLTRSAWIQEAIQEKLKRLEDANQN